MATIIVPSHWFVVPGTDEKMANAGSVTLAATLNVADGVRVSYTTVRSSDRLVVRYKR